jgi:hypothetical protein
MNDRTPPTMETAEDAAHTRGPNGDSEHESERRTRCQARVVASALLHRETWIKHHGVGTRRLASTEFIHVFRGYCTPRESPASLNDFCRIVQAQILPDARI